MKKILLFAILLMSGMAAQAQFTLDAVLRPRAEYRHGYIRLAPADTDPAFSISQRTRLNAGYGAEKFSFYLSMQDVRTWGSTSQLNVADNFFSVHQAYGIYNFTSNLSMKIGRQEIIYDDARIFGNVDWAQQGRSHDAFLLMLRSNNEWKVDLGLAFNQDKQMLFTTTYTVAANYKTLQYIWLHKQIKNFGFSILAMNQGFQFTNDSDSSNIISKTVFNQNIGTRLTYNVGKFKFAGATYFQFGKDTKDKDLAGSYYALSAAWNFVKNWTATLGFEHLSGTDQDATDNTNRSFTPWYGTNHKFNGFMDYFYVGSWVNSVGLTDAYLGVTFKKERWLAMLNIHYFQSGANIMSMENMDKVMDPYLGTELDFVFSYQMAESVALKAGYSQMFATETLQVMKGGDYQSTNNWAWVMLVFTPKLVK